MVKMNEIISILMKRDNLTKEEATNIYQEAKARIDEAIANDSIFEVEDIMMEEFGLEMDYIFDII